ncbi:MAG TPA: GFA family protein [Opitutus sp.]|nr:GFA family protein [Opitutus sp.]
MITTPFTGGCQCGAVRYECDARLDEIFMFKCHCRDCQRLSGGAFTPVVFVPRERLRITRGEIRRHATQGESGEHIRGFCPSCGSRLTGGEGPGSPGIGVTAASLDDPSGFEPQMEIWVSDAQPWDILNPALPHLPQNPPP